MEIWKYRLIRNNSSNSRRSTCGQHDYRINSISSEVAMQNEPDVTLENELLTKLGQSLVRGNLTDPELLARTDDNSLVQILPDANVIKIGGQSLLHRGRAAVFPLIEEIVAKLRRPKMNIRTRARTRAPS